MNFLKKTFLYRVYQTDRLLFGGFVLFLIGQLFFTYKGVETFPFLHYGMYSEVAKPKSTYTAYQIIIDGAEVKSGNFYDPQREIVYNSIAGYDRLKAAKFNDTLVKVIDNRFSGALAARAKAALLNSPQMDTPYQRWLFQYIADMRLVKDPDIDINAQPFNYDAEGHIQIKEPKREVFHLRDE